MENGKLFDDGAALKRNISGAEDAAETAPAARAFYRYAVALFHQFGRANVLLLKSKNGIVAVGSVYKL